MKTEHLADVHPIDVVTSKNTDMLRIGIFDEVHVLVNGIRGAFIPTFPRPHLRRYRIDEVPSESGLPPAFPEMLHQRMRFKLGEDKNLEKTGIDKITQGKIDDPVIPPKRNSRFGADRSQGTQTFSFSACKDHCQDSAHGCTNG